MKLSLIALAIVGAQALQLSADPVVAELGPAPAAAAPAKAAAPAAAGAPAADPAAGPIPASYDVSQGGDAFMNRVLNDFAQKEKNG